VNKSTLVDPQDWIGQDKTDEVRQLVVTANGRLESIGILETLGWTAAIVALDAMDKAAQIQVIQAEWNDMLGSVIKIAGSTSHVQSALEAGFAIADSMHPKLDANSPSRTLTRLINRPDEQAIRAILSPDEYNVLIEQNVVKRPNSGTSPTREQGNRNTSPTREQGNQGTSPTRERGNQGTSPTRERGNQGTSPTRERGNPKTSETKTSETQASTTSPINEGKTTMAASNPNSQALGFIETQGFTAVFEAIDTACKAASVEVVGKEKLGGGYVTVVIRGDVAAVNAAIEAAKPRVEGLGKLIACHVIARPSTAALGLLPK
jgi:microcompartment protein CcmL/EutN